MMSWLQLGTKGSQSRNTSVVPAERVPNQKAGSSGVQSTGVPSVVFCYKQVEWRLAEPRLEVLYQSMHRRGGSEGLLLPAVVSLAALVARHRFREHLGLFELACAFTFVVCNMASAFRRQDRLLPKITIFSAFGSLTRCFAPAILEVRVPYLIILLWTVFISSYEAKQGHPFSVLQHMLLIVCATLAGCLAPLVFEHPTTSISLSEVAATCAWVLLNCAAVSLAERSSKVAFAKQYTPPDDDFLIAADTPSPTNGCENNSLFNSSDTTTSSLYSSRGNATCSTGMSPGRRTYGTAAWQDTLNHLLATAPSTHWDRKPFGELTDDEVMAFRQIALYGNPHEEERSEYEVFHAFLSVPGADPDMLGPDAAQRLIEGIQSEYPGVEVLNVVFHRGSLLVDVTLRLAEDPNQPPSGTDAAGAGALGRDAADDSGGPAVGAAAAPSRADQLAPAMQHLQQLELWLSWLNLPGECGTGSTLVMRPLSQEEHPVTLNLPDVVPLSEPCFNTGEACLRFPLQDRITPGDILVRASIQTFSTPVLLKPELSEGPASVVLDIDVHCVQQQLQSRCHVLNVSTYCPSTRAAKSSQDIILMPSGWSGEQQECARLYQQQPAGSGHTAGHTSGSGGSLGAGQPTGRSLALAWALWMQQLHALCDAAESGAIDASERAVAMDVDGVGAMLDKGAIIMMQIVERRCPEMAEKMLQSFAKVNGTWVLGCPSRSGDSLLHHAVLSNSPRQVDQVLTWINKYDLGVSWGSKNARGLTPLHVAIMMEPQEGLLMHLLLKSDPVIRSVWLGAGDHQSPRYMADRMNVLRVQCGPGNLLPGGNSMQTHTARPDTPGATASSGILSAMVSSMLPSWLLLPASKPDAASTQSRSATSPATPPATPPALATCTAARGQYLLVVNGERPLHEPSPKSEQLHASASSAQSMEASGAADLRIQLSWRYLGWRFVCPEVEQRYQATRRRSVLLIVSIAKLFHEVFVASFIAYKLWPGLDFSSRITLTLFILAVLVQLFLYPKSSLVYQTRATIGSMAWSSIHSSGAYHTSYLSGMSTVCIIYGAIYTQLTGGFQSAYQQNRAVICGFLSSNLLSWLLGTLTQTGLLAIWLILLVICACTSVAEWFSRRAYVATCNIKRD